MRLRLTSLVSPGKRPIHLPRVPYPEMICRAQLNLVKKKTYGGQSE